MFTVAPRTPALTLMHAVGRFFPRGIARRRSRRSRAALERVFEASQSSELALRARQRIDSGFYVSQAMEVARMSRASAAIVQGFMRIGPQFLPFADAATAELPLLRLLRLSLFQVTVGMAAVLLIGTLNRVMIVELAVPSWIVASCSRCRSCSRRCAR